MNKNKFLKLPIRISYFHNTIFSYSRIYSTKLANSIIKIDKNFSEPKHFIFRLVRKNKTSTLTESIENGRIKHIYTRRSKKKKVKNKLFGT